MMEDNRSDGDHYSKINAEKEIVENEDMGGNLSQADSEEWTTAGPRRKRHIELRDLTEQTFLELIEAKNQDKRFYGWLNFKPLLDEF